MAEFGDPMLFDIPGGILVKHPKTEQIMGGIGVAGLPAGPGDSDVALAGGHLSWLREAFRTGPQAILAMKK